MKAERRYEPRNVKFVTKHASSCNDGAGHLCKQINYVNLSGNMTKYIYIYIYIYIY